MASNDGGMTTEKAREQIAACVALGGDCDKGDPRCHAVEKEFLATGGMTVKRAREIIDGYSKPCYCKSDYDEFEYVQANSFLSGVNSPEVWKREDVRAVVEALRRISEEHCQYEYYGSSSYGIGVTDGHRCAATIAKEALSKVPKE